MNYNSDVYDYEKLGGYYLVHPLDPTRQINSYRNCYQVFTNSSYYPPAGVPITNSSRSDLKCNVSSNSKRKWPNRIDSTGNIPSTPEKSSPRPLEDNPHKRTRISSRNNVETEEKEARAKNLERNRLAGRFTS